jgi:hypothetical protein
MPDRPAPPRVPECDRILELYESMPEEEAEALTELFKENFGFLIPTYDKLSLFLATITLLLLYFGNSHMQEQILGLTQLNWRQKMFQDADFWPLFCFISLMFFAVLGFRVFRFGKEGNFIKKVMLIFAILINSVIGIVAGVYIIRNTVTPDWLLVFPIWNIINCALLLFILFFTFINEDCISDRRVTLFRFCLGLTAVLIIFCICNNAFKLHWAITYSICIIYTTSFDRALQNVFPGLTRQKAEVEP